MLRALLAVSVIVAAGPAFGFITVDVTTSTSGSSVANSLNVTTTDYGWSGAQLYVELWEGSVVNLDPAAGGVDRAPTQAQIDAIPALLFDTYYGVVGQSYPGLGGAFELSGSDTLDLGPNTVNASWTTTPGLAPPSSDLSIGNFVFSDDANGNVYLNMAEPYIRTLGFGGYIQNGIMYIEPWCMAGDLNNDWFVGIEDLNIILSHWNQDVTPGDLTMGDPTGDAFVGIDDLGVVLGNWNADVTSLQWPEGTTADMNGDGFVGLGDLDLVLSNWHQSVTPGDLLSGDVSGDGFVGFDDVVIVNALWNSGTPPIALPEPAAIAILSLGTLVLMRRR